jgi:DNA-binding transcriptional LysR family regulator
MNRLRFDLDDLQAMVAVVEQGGFRAAALSLNLSQPALSRRIAKLEDALNVQLFERTTRRVALTLMGREFYARAVEILQGVEASLRNISDPVISQGQVTVACVPSVAHHFLPPIMQRFQQQAPRVRLRIVDEGAHAVLNHVARGDSDFGINFLGHDEAGIDFEPILHERFVLACRLDHPLARRRSVGWDDIGKHATISVAKSSGNRMVLDRAAPAGAARLPSMVEVSHVSTLLEMVKAGLGVGVVPQLAMPLDDPVLRSVALKGEPITRTLGVIRRAGRILAPPAQHFYDMLRDALPAAGTD